MWEGRSKSVEFSYVNEVTRLKYALITMFFVSLIGRTKKKVVDTQKMKRKEYH